ncbi:MAG: hypothetical protein WKF37_21360 [Bryobacteraceae bacterium]
MRASSVSRLTGGPFLELHLPLRLSVEFSTLFRTSRQNESRPSQLGQAQNPYLVSSIDKVQTWDFPLLLKYRFTEGTFRPFVGAGGAWSHRRSQFEVFYSCLGPQGSCRPTDYPTELFGGFRSRRLRDSAGRQRRIRYSKGVPYDLAGSTLEQIVLGRPDAGPILCGDWICVRTLMLR